MDTAHENLFLGADIFEFLVQILVQKVPIDKDGLQVRVLEQVVHLFVELGDFELVLRQLAETPSNSYFLMVSEEMIRVVILERLIDCFRVSKSQFECSLMKAWDPTSKGPRTL